MSRGGYGTGDSPTQQFDTDQLQKLLNDRITLLPKSFTQAAPHTGPDQGASISHALDCKENEILRYLANANDEHLKQVIRVVYPIHEKLQQAILAHPKCNDEIMQKLLNHRDLNESILRDIISQAEEQSTIKAVTALFKPDNEGYTHRT